MGSTTFQRMMNDILGDFIDRCAMVYLDDIIIFSKTEEEHIQNVLDVVRALGHIASGEGLRPNPDKIEAILKWPSCSTITEVRGFLNIAGYYRRFIRGFAQEAGPLYELLEGSPCRGTPRRTC